MPTEARFSVELAKQDFKFSAAHFTLFGEGRSEPLHGHNYQVRVRIDGRQLDHRGLLVDFASLKKTIRELCGRLDDRILLPEEAEGIESQECGGQLEVRLEGRRYELPANEVVLLPLANTSVELLSRWLWQQLAPSLMGSPAETLEVGVEETLGQSGSFSARLE